MLDKKKIYNELIAKKENFLVIINCDFMSIYKVIGYNMESRISKKILANLITIYTA